MGTNTHRNRGYRLTLSTLAMLAMLLLSNLSPAHAAGMIVFDGSPSSAAPPAALGPYTMTPFALDPRPHGWVTDVAAPTGVLQLDQELFQTVVGDHWGYWGHGYAGNVYYMPQSNPERVVITLPPGTAAFYFYAMMPDRYTANVEVTANNAVSSGPIPTGGFEARYFGFYATGGATLNTITVQTEAGASFALGEFGIAQLQEHYSVRFHQPLDPSTGAGSVANKAEAGRTIPVKVEIFQTETEQDPTNVVGPPTLVISQVSCSAGSADQVESYVDSSANGSSPTFRWSADAPGFWIAHLDTKAAGMTVGTCYRLDVYLDDTLVTHDDTEWAIVEITR